MRTKRPDKEGWIGGEVDQLTRLKGGQGRVLVPEVGFEPTRSCLRQILSLLRLPFRHSGSIQSCILLRPQHLRNPLRLANPFPYCYTSP